MKIAIVFDKFGPYHVARIAGAARFSDVVAVEVSPHNSEYAWDSPDRPANLAYVALSDEVVQAGDGAAMNRLFDARLGPVAPDCVALPGWSSRTALGLLAWCRDRGIPAICMSETNGWDFIRSWPREFIKKGVVAHYASALVTSDSQASYIGALGIAPDAVFRGYNVVDNDYFSASTDAVRASGAMPVIAGRPMPQGWRGRYFLASNRFIEKKNLPMLLRAYSDFRQGRAPLADDWPLVMLGDGELRGALVDLTRSLGLDAHVHFAGFRQYDELPAFYATAGAFVHVSTTEQWGLVINEAMASGLPAIVSRRCGCTEVLIADGENGLLIDPHDGAGMTVALSRMADPVTRERLSSQAARSIGDWGPARFGTGIRDAAAAALQRGPARPGLIARQSLKVAISRLA